SPRVSTSSGMTSGGRNRKTLLWVPQVSVSSPAAWQALLIAAVSAASGRVVLVITEMVSKFLVESGLPHRPGPRLQQPVRAGQRQTLLPANRTTSLAASNSGLDVVFFRGVITGSVAAITAPLPPGPQGRARQAGNTERSTVPSPTPRPGWCG